MTVFGNELHRYSISDGIRDKNVLGFDTYKIETFSEQELRKAVALHLAKASTVEEAILDPRKKETFYEFMEKRPMAGYQEKMDVISRALKIMCQIANTKLRIIEKCM